MQRTQQVALSALTALFAIAVGKIICIDTAYDELFWSFGCFFVISLGSFYATEENQRGATTSGMVAMVIICAFAVICEATIRSDHMFYSCVAYVSFVSVAWNLVEEKMRKRASRTGFLDRRLRGDLTTRTFDMLISDIERNDSILSRILTPSSRRSNVETGPLYEVLLFVDYNLASFRTIYQHRRTSDELMLLSSSATPTEDTMAA